MLTSIILIDLGLILFLFQFGENLVSVIFKNTWHLT
jgi:hypothetical protein